MSEKMYPIPFKSLMNWIVTEYAREGEIFGVHMPYYATGKMLPIFGETIETPFGPAAGPNSQLAQNIIAAYMAGARFFEVKTVQKMDGADLAACINRPCILAEDECYNCEWSTELEVPQAFAEYVKAWFACHLIAREYGLGSPDGFVFNMSVGYDLEGIKSPKVDAYIEGMKDASGSDVWNECRTWALANLDKFEHVDAAFVESIPARVSNSITESTLHGCPPAEIERIATYLITEKGLNTYIKCNPTLLGYEFARQRLNELGFDYIEVLAGFALFEYFADAEYGRQAVGESQGHFFAEGFGCFTIVLTSFAVAEDDIGGAGGGYHFGGNFACICSFDVVGAVLCTQSEFAFICDYGVH